MGAPEQTVSDVQLFEQLQGLFSFKYCNGKTTDKLAFIHPTSKKPYLLTMPPAELGGLTIGLAQKVVDSYPPTFETFLYLIMDDVGEVDVVETTVQANPDNKLRGLGVLAFKQILRWNQNNVIELPSSDSPVLDWPTDAAYKPVISEAEIQYV